MSQVEPVGMAKEAFVAKARSAIQPYLKACGISTKQMGETELTEENAQDVTPVPETPAEPEPKPEVKAPEAAPAPKDKVIIPQPEQPSLDVAAEMKRMQEEIAKLKEDATSKRFESIESTMKDIQDSIKKLGEKPEPAPEPEPEPTPAPEPEAAPAVPEVKEAEPEPESDTPLEKTKEISVGELLIMEAEGKEKDQVK